MRRLFFWGTVASGIAAALIMHKRGESLGSIARKAGLNPVGSLVSELRGAR